MESMSDTIEVQVSKASAGLFWNKFLEIDGEKKVPVNNRNGKKSAPLSVIDEFLHGQRQRTHLEALLQ